MTEQDVDSVLSKAALLDPPYPFVIGRGELACFLSHRMLWQRMVDENIQQALIFEDDVRIGPGFANALDIASHFAGTEGFVQFQTRPIRGRAERVLQEGQTSIVRPAVVPRRTSAQLVTIGAVRRLLAASRHIDRPVDGFLQLVWATGQPVHCVQPSCVADRTDEVGGSVAQVTAKTGWTGRLRRAVVRARYRAAVVRMSNGSAGRYP